MDGSNGKYAMWFAAMAITKTTPPEEAPVKIRDDTPKGNLRVMGLP